MDKSKKLESEFAGWGIGTEYACHTNIIDSNGRTVASSACGYSKNKSQEFRLSRLLLSAPDLLLALEALSYSRIVQGHGAAIRDEAKRKGLDNPLELASMAIHKARGL